MQSLYFTSTKCLSAFKAWQTLSFSAGISLSLWNWPANRSIRWNHNHFLNRMAQNHSSFTPIQFDFAISLLHLRLIWYLGLKSFSVIYEIILYYSPTYPKYHRYAPATKEPVEQIHKNLLLGVSGTSSVASLAKYSERPVHVATPVYKHAAQDLIVSSSSRSLRIRSLYLACFRGSVLLELVASSCVFLHPSFSHCVVVGTPYCCAKQLLYQK